MASPSGGDPFFKFTTPPKAQESSAVKSVNFANLQGYQDFQKALKKLTGEASASPEPRPAKEAEPQQIDSSVGANTFAQIDPLFTQALNASSMQAIKDSDTLIK